MFDTSSTNFFFSSKAVADGAISYYIDHFVQTRVSKLTYGIRCRKTYDPGNPEHRKRSTVAYTCGATGKTKIRGIFWVTLSGVSWFKL